MTKTTVFIERFQLRAHIGCLPYEQIVAQNILIDFQADAHCARAMTHDTLADTVNYAAIMETITHVVNEKHYHLLEHLGHAILSQVCDDFPLENVYLKLRKPHVSQAAEAVGVEMRR